MRHFSIRGKYLNIDVLMKSISVNNTITHLDLRKLNLGDQGITELALSIRKNKTIRYLNVDDNGTGMNGFYGKILKVF